MSEDLDTTILLDVYDYIGKFVVFPSVNSRLIHTLWIAHTHLVKDLYHTPRLYITSADRGCGKTTLLDVTSCLVQNAISLVSPSPASIFRLIEKEKPTLLIDELENLFGYRKDTSDITTILDAGFQKSEKGVPRVNNDTKEVERFDVHGAIVLSGIDLGKLPETVVSRCIEVRLERATKKETEEVISFRPRLHGKIAQALKDRLTKWSISVKTLVHENSCPTAPEGIFGRNEDRWESLFIIADVADIVTCVTPVTDVTGKSPLSWGSLIRAAATEILEETTYEQEENYSNSELLLNDMRDLVGRSNYILSTVLVDKLVEMTDRDWDTCEFGKPLTPKSLARRLKRFKIRPVQERVEGHENPVRIYKKDDKLLNVWQRHLKGAPEIAVTDVTDVTPVTDGGVSSSLSIPPSPFWGDVGKKPPDGTEWRDTTAIQEGREPIF
jgi:hypothetical protein